LQFVTHQLSPKAWSLAPSVSIYLSANLHFISASCEFLGVVAGVENELVSLEQMD